MKGNILKKRVAAAYIDQSFTSFIPFVYFIYYFLKGIQEKWTLNEYITLLLLSISLNIFIYVVYHTIFEMSKWNGSIGKHICGLQVYYIGGTEKSVITAVLRNFISCITTTLLIGYLFPLIHRNRKTIQDICTKTIVISKQNKNYKE